MLNESLVEWQKLWNSYIWRIRWLSRIRRFEFRDPESAKCGYQLSLRKIFTRKHRHWWEVKEVKEGNGTQRSAGLLLLHRCTEKYDIHMMVSVNAYQDFQDCQINCSRQIKSVDRHLLRRGMFYMLICTFTGYTHWSKVVPLCSLLLSIVN